MTFKEQIEIEKSNEKKVASMMTDALNDYSWNPKRFAMAMSLQHRTLQQKFMKTMVEVINYMASDDYLADGRNKASKELAVKLNEITKEAHLPLI